MLSFTQGGVGVGLGFGLSLYCILPREISYGALLGLAGNAHYWLNILPTTPVIPSGQSVRLWARPD